jgi:hypothetical protein
MQFLRVSDVSDVIRTHDIQHHKLGADEINRAFRGPLRRSRLLHQARVAASDSVWVCLPELWRSHFAPIREPVQTPRYDSASVLCRSVRRALSLMTPGQRERLGQRRLCGGYRPRDAKAGAVRLDDARCSRGTYVARRVAASLGIDRIAVRSVRGDHYVLRLRVGRGTPIPEITPRYTDRPAGSRIRRIRVLV